MLHCVHAMRWGMGFRGALGPGEIRDTDQHSDASITLVLPVRNEVETLPRLLADLSEGSVFPAEVIVIDDDSSDGTTQMLADLAAGGLPFALRVLANPGSGKKAGLSTGIRAARTPWTVQVDADVRVGKGFIAAIQHHLHRQGAQSDMLLLPLRLADRANGSPQRMFDLLQALDFAAMQGWAVAAARRARPAMASGGAWAWRNRAFPHDGLRPELASGDDVFSLAALLERGDGHRVGWCGNTEAMASAAPMPDMRSLLDQRIRWGAKSSAYPKALHEARRVATTIAAVHVSGLVLLVVSPAAAVAFWTGKAIIDITYTHQVGKAFGLFGETGRIRRWSALMLLALVHPPFIITTLLLMPFRKVRWKGRPAT